MAESLQRREALFKLWHNRGTARLGSFRHLLDCGHWREASHDLHEAAECFYGAALLTFIGDKPWTHDLRGLGRLAEQVDAALGIAAVFPDRQLFDLLNEACEGSRYDLDFRITEAQLRRLSPYVMGLGIVVHRLCRTRLESSA